MDNFGFVGLLECIFATICCFSEISDSYRAVFRVPFSIYLWLSLLLLSGGLRINTTGRESLLNDHALLEVKAFFYELDDH